MPGLPLFLLAVLAAAMTPVPGCAATLEDILAEVYRTNPTIEAARGRLRETNERVPQAKSGWRPTVRLNGEVGRRTVDTEDPLRRDGTSSPASAGLSVTQPIYRGGRTLAQVNRAERQVAAQRARVTSTTQQVLARAVTVYASVRRDRQILEFTQRNVDILRDLVAATEDRQAEGFVTATDLAEARSRLSGAIARRDDAKGQLDASEAQFEEVVGRPPPSTLTPITRPSALPSSRQAAVAAAGGNPALTQAQLETEAARDAVRVAEGELLPSLSLRGDARVQEDLDRDGTRQETAEVRLQLDIPLYQAGRVQSEVREAKQRANRRRIEATETERAVRQQAASAWADYTSARARIGALQDQVDQAAAALEGAQAEFRAGTRTIRNVLDAESERINAQIQLARAQRALDVAAFNLLRATGRLTPERLGLAVEPYDPEPSYEAVDDAWIGLSAPEAEPGGDASGR